MVDFNLGQLVATALRSRDGKLADNITNKNALLRRLSQKGKVVTHSGGRTIVKGVEYAENGNFQYYTGYQLLDISPTDTFDAAEYSWRHAATNIAVSGPELRKTSGPDALVDLVMAKMGNAERTMANNLSTGLYSDGTGSSGLQVDGLQIVVADDPTTGTIGGIDSSVQTVWRNISYDATTDGGAAATSALITGYMNTTYNQLTRGDDAPDLIVADLNYFGFYEASLQSQQRFATPSEGAAGFTAYRYKGADVILDNGSGIPTNHMYFLNTDFLSWDVHADANVTALTERFPTNQDAQVVPVIWMGNLTCSNRSLQGVLKD